MEWIQVLAILSGNFGLFLWIRKETREDMRHFETEMRSWKEEVNNTMKDFHGRLCTVSGK